MTAEYITEFLPASALGENNKDLDARFKAAFPNLDFTFAKERIMGKEWVKKNSRYLIVPISLSLISADAVKHFSWTPTILSGIAGGIGGFFWELADGSSSNKTHGVRTEEGTIAVVHDGSSFAELFVSTIGGILAGSSMGAGLTSGIDSKLAYALGSLGLLPGITLCRATKQRIWPLKK